MAKPTTQAAGGPVSCQASYVQARYQGQLSGALDCQNGVARNDTLNPLIVNTESFFEENDWSFVAKYDGAQREGQDIGLDVGGFGALSGVWSIGADALANFGEFMVVLKAGTEFAGFFFDDVGTTGGTWGYGAAPGLSHLSVYARGQASVPPSAPMPTPEPDSGGTPPAGTTAQVTEPATPALLALGLLCVTAMRRRRASRPLA